MATNPTLRSISYKELDKSGEQINTDHIHHYDNIIPIEPSIALKDMTKVMHLYKNEAGQEVIGDDQKINQQVDDRRIESETIDDKPILETTQQHIRQMTNHEHLVAKRAHHMGITVEEYQVKFPKGGPLNGRE